MTISCKFLIRLMTPTFALAMISLSGCGSSLTSDEADALRRKVLDLEKMNLQMSLRTTELEAELKRQSAGFDSLPVEIRENTPRVARLTIGRLSHARDDDDDGRSETLLIYVDPEDGFGRFVQLVGTLTVHAAILPADRDAITIGRFTLKPGPLRAAYRSGFSGMHYTIELPIQLSPENSGQTCLVRVIFKDGLTGLVHSTEREIKLQ
ncbi:MAG: hypothetical protein IIB54_00195 [Planctomycetes bacterium]|nr:hypothetical protein [Planctomycetota bacterium]